MLAKYFQTSPFWSTQPPIQAHENAYAGLSEIIFQSHTVADQAYIGAYRAGLESAINFGNRRAGSNLLEWPIRFMGRTPTSLHNPEL